MKNPDVISRRITVTGIAICCILLCASVFMFSLGNVTQSHAAEPKFIAPAGAGSVMMVPYLDKDGYQNILVWDTETGRSQSWYVNVSTNKCTKNAYNLPVNPME